MDVDIHKRNASIKFETGAIVVSNNSSPPNPSKVWTVNFLGSRDIQEEGSVECHSLSEEYVGTTYAPVYSKACSSEASTATSIDQRSPRTFAATNRCHFDVVRGLRHWGASRYVLPISSEQVWGWYRVPVAWPRRCPTGIDGWFVCLRRRRLYRLCIPQTRMEQRICKKATQLSHIRMSRSNTGSWVAMSCPTY